MKVTINNLLLESIIDELPNLTKMDKAVLKFLHNSKDTTTLSLEEFEEYDGHIDKFKVLDLMKTFGLTDADYIFKIWNIYKKYGGILFSDFDNLYEYNLNDYDVVTTVLMMNYYFKNIVGKKIYPGWEASIIDSWEVVMLEEMFTIEVRSLNTPNTIFCDVFNNAQNNKLVMQWITMDHGGFGNWMKKKGITMWNDTIATKEIIVKPPKDLTDDSLKKYFNIVMDEIHEFIDSTYVYWEEYDNISK